MPGAKLICMFVVVLIVLVVLVVGCGGNGQEGAAGPLPDGSGGTDNLEIGPLVMQTAKTGNFKAVDIPSPYGCSFVALYGAQINYLASTAMLDRVVFASNRSGNFQIYVCNLDGSGSSLVRLTNNNAKDEYPRWSPDGSKIVFQRTWPKKESVICTMNADGSDATTLTTDISSSRAPEWSPEGGRVAFHHFINQRWDVYTMNADSSNATNLTIAHGTINSSPSWSPDGRTIVFATNKYGDVSDLASIGAYGGAATRITNDSFSNRLPAFCPQLDYGSRIAYVSTRGWAHNDDIFIMTIGDTVESSFTAHAAEDTMPRWSSDGRLIAFQSDRSGNKDVWVQEVDAPHAMWQVTKHSAYDAAPDLGSPTMQTERVLIGPDGSDRGGKNPLYPSAPAVITAFNTEGYRNLVRIGVAAADLASLRVRPLSVGTAQITAFPSMPGVEVSAKKIPNLREDAGWGKPAKVWDFTALNPGMVLLYFNPETGKLATAVPVKDSTYPSAVGSASDAPYRVSPAGDGVQLAGSFSGVFDAEGRNLAESGASSVTLSADGQVLQVR
jgi:Tol biopolymer transport system component